MSGLLEAKEEDFQTRMAAALRKLTPLASLLFTVWYRNLIKLGCPYRVEAAGEYSTDAEVERWDAFVADDRALISAKSAEWGVSNHLQPTYDSQGEKCHVFPVNVGTYCDLSSQGGKVAPDLDSSYIYC